MSLRSVLSALTWRDVVCGIVGCKRPRGNASHSYICLCTRCGRVSFVEVKR